MNENYLYPVLTMVIIFVLFAAGCVAPPQETTSTNPIGVVAEEVTTPVTTTQSSFVSEVTLSDYTTRTNTPSAYTTFAPTTQIPADITCRIHSISISANNGSAFVFNLRNAPMYINYTVIPTNVTLNKVYTDSFTKKTVTKTYSDYSPTSWFEVTVRNNATKEIILQDGFGENKGYSTYLSHTMKVLRNGDLLVEFRGSDIKASASIWVKPIGNFDESRLSEFTDCMYWDNYRDTIATPVPTTIEGAIYTWKPENQING